MGRIAVLDEQTIDKIAAGEVIERPASIVKELAENAIDAGATAVTVEIRDGGISFIRITDNGSGMEADDIRVAFLRHATSKIRRIEDLNAVTSLGFRGEALSSIAAVCQVELITKTPESLTGIRYIIEGGKEKSMEEIGAPSGTTFLVRNLFFNTPARRKFLKTAQTEAGYISELMERMALSHPEVSFKFITGSQTKLHTSGNHNLKDIIYNVYGRDIANNLAEVHEETPEGITLDGFIGKPVISRGNRNYENYFVNGRYIKSKLISKAIEDAYAPYMMKHKYPFTVLHITIDGKELDINVHPTKMELRFSDNEGLYRFLTEAVSKALGRRELIPRVSVGKEEKLPKNVFAPAKSIPEPFETRRRNETGGGQPPAEKRQETPTGPSPAGKRPENQGSPYTGIPTVTKPRKLNFTMAEEEKAAVPELDAILQTRKDACVKEEDFFSMNLLDRGSVKEHRIIGQVFDTYWLIEFRDQMYIIDQHAAHEKVLYERTMKSLENRQYTSQMLDPPLIYTLSMQEENLLKKNMDSFTEIGFEIEEFGGREYALRSIPDNLFGISKGDLFLEMLDSLDGQTDGARPEIIKERIASMSCKAAVKGNHRLSVSEIHALIDELMTLDNPYHCPHGRPTIVAMSKYEMEKKFKRIV